ncbi:MAG TPA: hypothetical protein VMC83_03040 [Streptosporangiaceae bacterium]|nr:hypothetical protein [Streptosporangiaceae bacterium]
MWWEDILIGAFLIIGVCCFLSLVGFNARRLTRKTSRTAENLYANFADSPRQQEKYAREHGGSWREDEGAKPSDVR